MAFSAVAGLLTWVVPGLSQVFLALVNFKWVAYFMLAYASFLRSGGAGPYLLGAFSFELLQGVGGFFSDFKTVFFVTLIAAAAANVRVTVSRVLVIGLLCTILMTFAVVWQAVKGEYRTFVSGGTGQHVVTVEFSERMAKLGELISEVDEPRLAEGLDGLIRRFAFVEYFGAVLTYVPAFAPHAEGEIWWDAITRPLMPRLFFPDKAIIDDTERTAKYTGVSTASSGTTSISLGYMPEAYIDFGVEGMMVPIFGFGLMLGGIQRAFATWKRSRGIVGMAVATTILLAGIDLGSSITKVMGGIIVLLLAMSVVIAYGPRWLSALAPTDGQVGHARD